MSRKKVVVIGVLLAVVVLGGVGAVAAWKYHEQPQFCATCHLMKPYLDSWVSSDYGAYAHAVQDVACLDCHVPTVQQQVDELVVYMRGDFTVPLEERTFGDQFCFDCHLPNEHASLEEVVQLTADLELNPHESHLGQVACEICHKEHRLSEDYCAPCHGPVATGAGWTTPVTTTAEIELWAPDMDCSACHVMDTYFASLEDPELLVYAHAQQGLQCLDCHEVGQVKRAHEQAVGGQPVTELSFDQQFCFDCHVPNEHTSLEQVIQRTAALEPNPHDSATGELDCETCHKMHQLSTVAWSPNIDCALCHAADVESMQDPNLLSYAHAQQGLTCTDCHSDLEALAQAHAGAIAGAPVPALSVDMQFCFDCHVPNEHTSYQQIIERTKDYVAENQNINPHDPHAGVEGMEPLECSRCHKVHEESLLIQGCYLGCHHAGLQSCTNCHEE